MPILEIRKKKLKFKLDFSIFSGGHDTHLSLPLAPCSREYVV